MAWKFDSDGLHTLGKPEHLAYRLEKHDKESVVEIKKLLATNGYKDRKTIEEHLTFLEELIDRLNRILALEQSEGEPALGLRKDFEEVKQLFAALSDYANNFQQKI